MFFGNASITQKSTAAIDRHGQAAVVIDFFVHAVERQIDAR